MAPLEDVMRIFKLLLLYDLTWVQQILSAADPRGSLLNSCLLLWFLLPEYIFFQDFCISDFCNLDYGRETWNLLKNIAFCFLLRSDFQDPMLGRIAKFSFYKFLLSLHCNVNMGSEGLKGGLLNTLVLPLEPTIGFATCLGLCCISFELGNVPSSRPLR